MAIALGPRRIRSRIKFQVSKAKPTRPARRREARLVCGQRRCGWPSSPTAASCFRELAL